MTSAHPALAVWAEWLRKLDALRQALRDLTRRGNTHVSAQGIRAQAKDSAQFYFRSVRQHLLDSGVDKPQVDALDKHMQDLIEFAAKITRARTYLKCTNALNKLRAPLETALEIAGTSIAAPLSRSQSSVEVAILKTLDQVAPTSALSYQQVLQDIEDSSRKSYRGTASELREVLRELLDHLAPDAAVMKSGIKLEPGQTKPTMKQKTAFILKARGVNETQRKTARDATDAVEGAVGSLARSVYDRGSLSTHVETTRQEVMTFKGYADAVLAELLEIHKN